MSASGQNFRSYWANKKFKIFAANPIKQVHEGCDFILCRRFPFKLNPADGTSNGLDPKKNRSSSKWFRAPECFQLKENIFLSRTY